MNRLAAVILAMLLVTAFAVGQQTAAQNLQTRIHNAQVKDHQDWEFSVQVLTPTHLHVWMLNGSSKAKQAAVRQWLKRHHFATTTTVIKIDVRGSSASRPLNQALDALNAIPDESGRAAAGAKAPSTTGKERLDSRINRAIVKEFGTVPPFRVDDWGPNSFRINVFGKDFYGGQKRAVRWLIAKGFYKKGGQLFYKDYTYHEKAIAITQKLNTGLAKLGDRAGFFVLYKEAETGPTFTIGVMNGPYSKTLKEATAWLRRQSYYHAEKINPVDYTHTEGQ